MVPQKNDENPVDGKQNKPGCDTDRRHKKRTNSYHKKKTARIPWTCVETEWPGKQLLTRNDERKESTGKTKTQIHGWYQGSSKYSNNSGSFESYSG